MINFTQSRMFKKNTKKIKYRIFTYWCTIYDIICNIQHIFWQRHTIYGILFMKNLTSDKIWEWGDDDSNKNCFSLFKGVGGMGGALLYNW